jgi:hypothetical protein
MSVSRVANDAANPTIAPNYRVSDWKLLNLGNASQAADWNKAVSIFHDRLNGRFLAQVEAMRNHADLHIKEWSGFAILAIDCLLIETLGQFYCGFDESPRKNNCALNPNGWDHREFYIYYMLSTSTLSQPNAFDTDEKRGLFYQHFRCGILHQAQTKKKSRVRYDERVMVAFADGADHSQGLIVDRDKLHDALVAEIEAYKTLLLGGTDQQKRQNFIKKMDFIAP